MNRFLVTLRSAFLLLPILPIAANSARAQDPVYLSASVPFPVDQKTVIPGKTLDPGSYSISIIDSLKDRYIVRVNDTAGKTLATFIGLHNPDFVPYTAARQPGPIFWNSAPKGATAVRGFSFSNGNTLEFVYPKNEAVTLAKLNTNSVPAIDPESEGRKPDPKLTPEDREVVTLWMLSATRVGPKNETPAIEAKRYVAPAETTVAPVQTATVLPTPVLRTKQARPAPVQLAKLEPDEAPRVRSSVKRLPKTAGEFPLILLLSALSLCTAAGLRVAGNRV